MRPFDRLSLSRQFLIASLPVMIVGCLAIGFWVEREIERGIVTRISEVQSLYVDSLVARHLPGLLEPAAASAQPRAMLDSLFDDTPLGRKIVAFVLWAPDGRVLYSTDPGLVGRQFPVDDELKAALDGRIYTHVIDRKVDAHPFARQDWPDRLIETYAPVHRGPLGEVVGAAEFYQNTLELDEAMRAARLRSWGVVATTTLFMYLLLFGLVHRGSKTIAAQREELRERVDELTRLAATNAALASKVQRAAARTASLNEGLLRRVAADLHDGPAQDLSFAQMRMESMLDQQSGDVRQVVAVSHVDLMAVRSALDLALADLRSICSGLQLPDLEALDVAQAAARAVRDYERKTGAVVSFEHRASAAGEAALPIRITLFRVLQEALANGFRHAPNAAQAVRLEESERQLVLEVSDRGTGFDAAAVTKRSHGGLAGMRERVRALGGTFELRSTENGTTVTVRLPTQVVEAGDD